MHSYKEIEDDSLLDAPQDDVIIRETQMKILLYKFDFSPWYKLNKWIRDHPPANRK